MPYKDPEKQREAWRRYYHGSEEQQRRTRERTLAARDRNRAYVDDLKLQPCSDCRGRFPAPAMDFDHLGGKISGVAKLVRDGVSIDRIKREIAKCELVCANCHRIRSARRGGWYHD